MMRNIRLELARNPDFPEGSSAHGYEFMAPLGPDGTLDDEVWKSEKRTCEVRRFWAGEEDEHGRSSGAPQEFLGVSLRRHRQRP
jgi:hypothetical protein